jgi:hypothetical protein
MEAWDKEVRKEEQQELLLGRRERLRSLLERERWVEKLFALMTARITKMSSLP